MVTSERLRKGVGIEPVAQKVLLPQSELGARGGSQAEAGHHLTLVHMDPLAGVKIPLARL